MDFFKKLLDQVKGIWSQWKLPQKLIFFGVIAALVLGVIMVFAFSAGPNMVPIFTSAIKDQGALDEMTQRLDAEGISYKVGADGKLSALDDRAAKRARAILIRENLVPEGTSPWDFLNVERWTTTDWERNVNLRLAIQRQLEDHITALGDIDAARVVVQIPEKTLFAEDQDPVTASVELTIAPGSDMVSNRKKITGVERLIQMAVPGLKKENIVIVDSSTTEQLNDWSNLAASDKIDLAQRELKMKRAEEQKYIKAVSTQFAQIFGEDRVRVINADVTMDMGKRTTQKTEITPIIIEPKDPTNPASEMKYEMSVALSKAEFNEQYNGSGFNPEGPPGQEGQTPPAYKDLSGVVGTYNRSDNKTNFEMNKAVSTEEGSPQVARIAMAVALDGQWKKLYDDKGALQRNPDGSIKREYVPVTKEEMDSA
jgi:flagellar M-ring protein FliF